jgi:hypothetical protein
METMKSAWLPDNFWTTILWLGCCLTQTRLGAADADVCAVCGRPFADYFYGVEDKVTLEKKHVCQDCAKSYPECFVCGLPVNTNAPGIVELSDRRVLCARDARNAVLREDDGLHTCSEVRNALDQLFSRFTTFPETNVVVGMVDRVHLQELFKLAGNDYHCPNVWGYTQSRTNHHRLEYLLKGILWDLKKPLAIINNHTFGLNEQATVRVGTTNIVVRCLGILPDSVQLQVAGSDKEQTLRLKSE